MKKTIITTALVISSLFGFSQTQVNYIKLLDIDTSQCHGEMFFYMLRDHYSPLGSIAEMTISTGEDVYQVKTICFRFNNKPLKWICFTSTDAENELYKVLNK